MAREKKSVKWEKVYVFISSTFNDMHAERDYLVKQVFPELREWCERRRLRLVDIDLRWGVTEQDATHNKNVVKVCLSRIDECRPFFLCFLGQRRGWVPKVEEVSGETYKDYPELKDHVGNASVTELEILHAVLNPLHKGAGRDPKKHADYYDKARHAFFFLRDDSYLRQIPSDPPLLRKTYTNEWIVNLEERAKEDALLRTWREIQIPGTGRPVYPYRARWNPDASTPETMLPLACPSTDTANVGRWAKQWRDAGVEVDGNKVGEKDKAKADEVNRKLSKGRLSDFTCEGKPLNKDIIDSEGKPLHEVIIEGLKHAISTDERYADHQETVQADELQKEIDQQEQFLFINSEGFIGRAGDFEALDSYVKGDSGRLFVITAPGGMGKTMLLANWLDRRQGLGLECKESAFHYRFIGQSDRSTTVPNMLRSLMLELQQIGGKIPKTYLEKSKDPQGNEITREVPLEIPYDPEKLMSMWLEYLPKLEGKTVIIVDAVNQLESGLTDLRWAPLNGLPGQVKLIISFREDSGEGKGLLEKLKGNDHVIHHRIPPFEDIEDRRRLVKAYLDLYLKDIDNTHLEEIIQMEGGGNPLFLKVVLSELRVFGSFQHLTQKIHDDFGDSPVTAFHGVLGRLEKDPAYSSVVPKQAVPLLFGLLSHARYGLLVDELSRLFIQSLTLADNAVGYQSASETVNLFIRQVRPFLALRNGRYDFFYEGFRAAAKDRYESTKDELPYRATSQGWHRGLSDYFYQLPLWAGKDEKGNDLPNRRKVSELLYHLTKGEKWARVEEILTDLYFIDAKCKAGMTYELIMDYNLALDGLPEAQKEKEEERKHDERMQRYIREMIEYAKKWNDARCRHYEDPVKNPMPKPEDIPLPEIISSVRLWTNEEIMRDTERIRDNPNRLDKVELFAQFVNAESHNFVNYASQPMFCIQQAYNHADSGPIHEATRDIYIKENDAIVILLKQYSLSRFNPHPACVHTLEGHSGNVIAVGIMPDARMVISESWDETLRIWDIQTGECLRILECHPSSDNGNAVSITPDGRLVVSGYQFGIRVWNLQTDECQHILKGHASQVKAVCITPDGRRAVSGDTSGNLRVWNLQTAECQRILEGHSGKVSALCITPNGRLVISGDPSGMLRVWDLQTDECQHILKGHASPVEAVCITPDGRRAVSGDTSGNLLVWDLQTAECQRILEGHSGEVSALCITPDGRRAISASYETLQATLRVWDLQTGECLRILDGSLRGINAVYVTPDGRMAVSGSYDKTLRVWDLQRGDCQRILRDISSFNAVCITPDGRMAVSGSWDKTLRVWDLQTGECLRIMEGHSDSIFAVYITPDGRRAVSGSWDKTLRVWDLQTGKYQLILEEHLRMVDCVETPDKRMAVLEDSDADILRILDLQRGECRCILRGQSSGVSAVDITPDGRRAVLGRGTLDHALHVWDLQTDECLRILVGHSFWVYAVCITPDGKIAISGGWDGTLRAWDIQVGECLNILMGHASQVEAVCITPDGRRAVSGDNSGNMRVWDIQTGMCIAFYNINYHISSFSMAKKDGDIVIGTRSGQVIFARIMNLMQKSPVVTATRLWLFDPSGKEGCWSDSLTCDCLHCGQRFTPEASVLDAIAKITQKHNLSPAQSPCLKLPREAWDDPCLVSACPYCQQPLKFNPFVVDNRERY